MALSLTGKAIMAHPKTRLIKLHWGMYHDSAPIRGLSASEIIRLGLGRPRSKQETPTSVVAVTLSSEDFDAMRKMSYNWQASADLAYARGLVVVQEELEKWLLSPHSS